MIAVRKVNENAVAVSFDPREILIRKPGRSEYGNEQVLVSIKDNKIQINKDVAKQFGISIE